MVRRMVDLYVGLFVTVSVLVIEWKENGMNFRERSCASYCHTLTCISPNRESCHCLPSTNSSMKSDGPRWNTLMSHCMQSVCLPIDVESKPSAELNMCRPGKKCNARKTRIIFIAKYCRKIDRHRHPASTAAILTIHTDFNPLWHTWRYAIRSDA